MIYTKRKYNFPDFLRLSYKCAPLQSVLLLLNSIVSAVVPTFSVFVTAGFIDTAISIPSGSKKLSDIYIYIILIIGIMCYERLFGTLIGLLRISYDMKLRLTAKTEMISHRAVLEYKHIENAATQDLIRRVCDNCEGRIAGMGDNFLGLMYIILQILGLVGILLVYAWKLVIVLVVFCVPLFYIGYRAGKKEYDVKKDTTMLDRIAGNFSSILCSRDNIDERYIYGYEKDINARYHDAYEKSRLHRKKVDKRNFFAMKSGSILLLMSTVVMCVPLLYSAANGEITYGLFVSLIPAINNFAQMMSWSLTYNINRIKENQEYLKDLTQFMSLSTTETANDLPVTPPVPFESLEFIDVSFKYPGTEPYILKNMSFRLEKGRRYSVVGVNGAGKTTITKLICGLYSEFEGEILINGISIRSYSLAQLKSLCSVVFQDFSKYSISFGENIAVGDINVFEKDSGKLFIRDDKDKNKLKPDFNNNMDTTETGHKIREAAELLNMTEVVAKLPGQYNSSLGKIRNDGVDLSGGEWQRVAMARAVMSSAQLKILDEPTAALDPISESSVYSEFEKISKGSATIFISHRLGSTKLADTILVVGDGKIIEQGSHNELIALGGVYAQMYSSQSEWYKTKNKYLSDPIAETV